jgi:hypothetical protein
MTPTAATQPGYPTFVTFRAATESGCPIFATLTVATRAGCPIFATVSSSLRPGSPASAFARWGGTWASRAARPLSFTPPKICHPERSRRTCIPARTAHPARTVQPRPSCRAGWVSCAARYSSFVPPLICHLDRRRRFCRRSGETCSSARTTPPARTVQPRPSCPDLRTTEAA